MPDATAFHSLNRRSFLTRGIAAVAAGTVLFRRWANAAELGTAVERTFRESLENFPNPERGFYAQRRSDRMERLESLRPQGISLLLVTFDLRDFRESDLTADKLAELGQALGIARTAGFKVIFRAAYGFTGRDYRVDPHDLALITRHIRQIGAVLAENRDVISGIQAGMLGPWGEWHGSNHGNPPSLEARHAVLWGWLESVPAPITVHVRRPMFIRDLFAAEPGGAELTAATAFSGSKLSRTGWHDDSFLVRPTDAGTYAERGWDRARELEWCSRHGRFTPFGGETVHTDTPMPVAEMIREMELLHATYLNIGYHPRVLQLWRETEYRGGSTFEHIARRLGYRLVAQRLRCPRSLRAGDAFGFEVTLRNTGFASPHLPRVVEAALLPTPAPTAQPAHTIVIPDADPRWWGPEAGPVTVRGVLPVPAAFPRGPCRLALRLGDPAERLRGDARYAIRLANQDIAFTAAGGWNILVEDLQVL